MILFLVALRVISDRVPKLFMLKSLGELLPPIPTPSPARPPAVVPGCFPASPRPRNRMHVRPTDW
jgi:hypothetical protein